MNLMAAIENIYSMCSMHSYHKGDIFDGAESAMTYICPVCMKYSEKYKSRCKLFANIYLMRSVHSYQKGDVFDGFESPM
jgi:hypothetical protein